MSRFAVLASGRGSNFAALARHFAGGRHSIAFLGCDQPEAPVVTRAEDSNIDMVHLEYPRVTAERTLLDRLRSDDVQLLVLAGFMRILSAEFLASFGRPVINIHPSLLPKHRGINAVQRSYESLDTYLGISIHFVDAGVDTGPILVQASFPKDSVDSLEEAEERIHALEHDLFPRAVECLCAATDLGRPG